MPRKDTPLTERYITPVYDAILELVGADDEGYLGLSREDVALIFDIIAMAQNEYTPGELCREIALSHVLGELDIPEPEPKRPIQLANVASGYWYDATTFVPPEGNTWFDSYVSRFGWLSPITPKYFHWCRLSTPYPAPPTNPTN